MVTILRQFGPGRSIAINGKAGKLRDIQGWGHVQTILDHLQDMPIFED